MTDLVVVVGPAGSGKSRVSRELARAIGATYLDKDSVAGPLVGFALQQAGIDPDDRDVSELYRGPLIELEYAGVLATAGDNLRLGRPVVIDAPFTKYLEEPDYLRHAAETGGWPDAVDVTVVEVTVDDEVRRRRLAARALPRDAWKLANWRAAVARRATCRWEGARLLRVDNSEDGATGAVVSRLVDELRTAPATTA